MNLAQGTPIRRPRGDSVQAIVKTVRE